MSRAPFFAALLLALAGCSYGSKEAGLAPPTRGTLAYQAGAPLLSLTVQSTGASAPIALVAARDGYRSFETADGYGLTFDRLGLLTATRGFGGDLAASDISQSADLIASSNAGQVQRYHSFFNSGEDVDLRAYVCDITVIGTQGTARHLRESCRNPEQSFTNEYWVAGGQIVNSRQWAGPGAGYLAFNPR